MKDHRNRRGSDDGNAHALSDFKSAKTPNYDLPMH